MVMGGEWAQKDVRCAPGALTLPQRGKRPMTCLLQLAWHAGLDAVQQGVSSRRRQKS